MIGLSRLEGFYRVAKVGGYARAVRELSYPLTQPALHQQVRKLEDEVGQRLLERVAKDRMALTPAGRHLYEYCAPFFDRLPQVVAEVTSGTFAGTLRIDAGPQEIVQLIPRWLRELRRAHPNARIDLHEIQNVDAIRLRNGDADLVVEYWPNPPGDVAQKVVAKVFALWVVPASCARKGRIAFDALGGLPFVSFPLASRERALQLAGLELAGLEPTRLLDASTTDGILGFVQAELGYSLVPWPSLAGPKLPGIASARLRGAGTEFAITASWLRQRPLDALLRSALDTAPNPRASR